MYNVDVILIYCIHVPCVHEVAGLSCRSNPKMCGGAGPFCVARKQNRCKPRVGPMDSHEESHANSIGPMSAIKLASIYDD